MFLSGLGNMKLSRKTKIISIILIIFVVITAGVLVSKNNIDDKPKNIIKILPDNVDLQINNFIYTEVGEDKSKWEVKAESAKYIKNQNLALFDRVKIKLNTVEGKIYIITGDKGQMQTDKKDLQIKGNVVIVSDTGERFSTDYLNFSDAEKKVYTDAPVAMENKKMKIKGTGFTLYIKTGELNLSSLVKAKIN
jgi:LPS export ABC transporter protein LptC